MVVGRSLEARPKMEDRSPAAHLEGEEVVRSLAYADLISYHLGVFRALFELGLSKSLRFSRLISRRLVARKNLSVVDSSHFVALLIHYQDCFTSG